MIGIVDYGVGNVSAFGNVYKRMNVPHKIVAVADEFADIDKAILPGVGSFDYAMSRFAECGLKDALESLVRSQHLRVLGVCVGMQMLAESSDEGELAGLGWIGGRVRRMPAEWDGRAIPLPHMGWDDLSPTRESALFRDLQTDAWFYYLHSYYFDCADAADELATCEYGIRFASAVNRGNVYGVQFHPEKSHDYGARLLRNFAEL